MNTQIVKQDGYYSTRLNKIYPSLEAAEQDEALEDICGAVQRLIQKDEDEDTARYYFEPHKEIDPIQCWSVLVDAMGLTWKDILKIIKENKENKSNYEYDDTIKLCKMILEHLNSRLREDVIPTPDLNKIACLASDILKEKNK